MPYTIVEQDSEFCVYRADDKGEPMGDTLGCHPTQEKAGAQIGAIEHSEEKAEKQAGADYLQRMADFIKEQYPSIWKLFDRSARGYAGGKAKAAKWQEMLAGMEADAKAVPDEEPAEKAAPVPDGVKVDAPIEPVQHSCTCPKCGATMDSDNACGETPCPKCETMMIDAEGKAEKSEYAMIAKSDRAQQKVWAVVLEPGRVDAQGDWMTLAEVEKAAHKWLAEYGKHGLLHKGQVTEDIRPVESYIAPLGFAMGQQDVPAGAWVLGVHIANESVWKQVESGELNGFSIHGWGKRRPKVLT